MRYIFILVALIACLVAYIAHADSMVVTASVPVNACNECIKLCR